MMRFRTIVVLTITAAAVSGCIVDGNENPTLELTITPENPQPGEEVTLDASNSSDPDGDTLSYTFLVSREGGDAVLTEQDSNNPEVTFTPERAGTYVADVTVEDGNGGMDNQLEHFDVESEGGETDAGMSDAATDTAGSDGGADTGVDGAG